MFQRTVLPDGPRVISSRMPGSRSLSMAVYVLAGSRTESREHSGVAHFMEHVTFKGTDAYPTTAAVSDAIERYGGSCNAATDRESTVYWARLPVREAERAFSVLSDLTIRPLLRDKDIARERDIIVEEIRSYRDDPGQYVFNLYDRAFFGDTPLGWEIAGEEETVQALPVEEIRSFWASTYRPGNTVVSVAGDLDHDTVVELVAKNFGTGNGVDPNFLPAPSGVPCQRFTIEERDVAQAHIALGVPALPRDHPDQWSLEMLNTILGEGSSSRLFQNVREEAGLAYDVHSFQSDYKDTGTLQVYAGVAPEDVGYVNAHATATPVGDSAETRVLKIALGEEHAYRTPVSGTKGATGHCLGAAGAVEATFSILALERGVLPPTINRDTPDPECDLDVIPNAAREQQVEVAVSNSFGFGGHNACLVFRRWTSD